VPPPWRSHVPEPYYSLEGDATHHASPQSQPVAAENDTATTTTTTQPATISTFAHDQIVMVAGSRLPKARRSPLTSKGAKSYGRVSSDPDRRTGALVENPAESMRAAECACGVWTSESSSRTVQAGAEATVSARESPQRIMNGPGGTRWLAKSSPRLLRSDWR